MIQRDRRPGELGEFCLCGGTLTGDVWPPDDEADLIKVWRKSHSGEGHGRTTQSIARSIRRAAQSGPRSPGQETLELESNGAPSA